MKNFGAPDTLVISSQGRDLGGFIDDAINHHRPPAIVALTNLVRLVMWRNLKKHVEDEVTLPDTHRSKRQ